MKASKSDNTIRKRLNRIILQSAFIALMVFALSVAALAVDKAEVESALSQLQSEHPGVVTYTDDGQVRALYGKPFGGGSTAIEAAENFRMAYARALGANPDELVRGNIVPSGQDNIPVMYDPSTGQYKFTQVRYIQQVDGIPVYGSELRLLVRNEPGYPLVHAVSTIKNVGEFDRADKASVNFTSSRIMIQSSYPALERFSEPKQVIFAGDPDSSTEPELAFSVEARSVDGDQKRLLVTDAETGEILYDENRIIFEDIAGNVSGLATEDLLAEQCGDEVPIGLPFAEIKAGTQTVYSDSTGDFIIPHEGTGQVIISSNLKGQYFDVQNWIGMTELVVTQGIPPGPANLEHNSGNTELVRSQVNGYLHANMVRSMALSFNPEYPVIAYQTHFPVVVNRTDGYCPGNAWYDYSAINFCQSGGGHPNTAFSTVIYHEYGHHLVASGGSGQDQYGEGMSDVVAMMITDDPGLAYGFYGACSVPLRTAVNTMQYPCTGESHYCGKLLSGSVWSVRNELQASYPDDYRQILGGLAINSILLHTGDQITPQIVIDWLVLDDDDGDIYNGTPHFDEICAGFADHSMPCPELPALSFVYPDGKPQWVQAEQESEFLIYLQSGTAAPVGGTMQFYYSISGGEFVEGTVTETNPSEFTVTLPAAQCGDDLSWYVQVEADNGELLVDPEGAPESYYPVAIATEAVSVFVDDFEVNTGWFETGDASDGNWERGVPLGDGTYGDPLTDFDGSGQCFLTGNSAGNSDVDDGTTRLTSPRFDLTGSNSLIQYARWYSNSGGGATHEDIMTVLLSDDNGQSWVEVETVGPVDQADGGWFVHKFWANDYIEPNNVVRIRFEVSDEGAGSVVEAAVDAFSIVDYECKTFMCGDVDGNEAVDIDDIVFLIDYVFGGGAAPDPVDSADVDCTGAADIDDVVYLIAYVFSGGPEPCLGC